MGRNDVRMALLCFAIAVVSGHAIAQQGGEPSAGHNHSGKDVPATTTSDAPESGPPKEDATGTEDGTTTTTQAPDRAVKPTAPKGEDSVTSNPAESRSVTVEQQSGSGHSSWRSWMRSKFAASKLLGLLLSGLAGFFLGMMAGGIMARRNMRVTGARNKDAEREIGEALRKPGIALAGVAEEIRDLERKFVQVDGESRAQIKQLEVSNADLHVQLSSLQRSPEQIRLEAAKACIGDAIQALATAPSDPDFFILDQTFELRAALEDTLQHLSALPAGEGFVPALLDALERGRLDHVLTMPSFLDTYFVDRPRWATLNLAYASIERLLTGLLQSTGVQLVRTPLLSVVSAAEARGGDVGDRRNVKKIPAVRQTAARVARDLDPSELLVVDCHAPGWQSNHRIGSKSPGLALFEPATWT